MWYGLKERTSEVREQLANELLDDIAERSLSNNLRNAGDYVNNDIKYFDHHWPFTKAGVYKRCKYCQTKRTCTYCIKCNVNLHLGLCYLKYHQMNDLRM